MILIMNSAAGFLQLLTFCSKCQELGVQAPVGYWDPAGLAKDGDVETFKRRRDRTTVGEKSGTVGWPWDLNIYTLLESKIAPANGPGPKRNVVFQAPIFRGYFSFREGKVADVTRWLQK